MSAVAVQKAQAVPSPAQPEAMDTGSGFEGQEDLYTKLKTLQRQLEFLDIQVGEIACLLRTREAIGGCSGAPASPSRAARPPGVGSEPPGLLEGRRTAALTSSSLPARPPPDAAAGDPPPACPRHSPGPHAVFAVLPSPPAAGGLHQGGAEKSEE